MLSFGLPTMGNGTFSTAQASPGRSRVTIGAMFGVSPWCGNFSSVVFFMAGNAQRQAISYVGRQVWKLSQWLYVVGVQIATFLPALLARKIITSIYGESPFFQFATEQPSFGLRRFSTFPNGRRFACFPFNEAFIRAESRSSIDSIELSAAGVAISKIGLSSIVPAFLGTPLGRARSVVFYFKLIAARFACFGYTIAQGFASMRVKTFDRTKPLFGIKRMKSAMAMLADNIAQRANIHVVALDKAWRISTRTLFGLRGQGLITSTFAYIHRSIITQIHLLFNYVAVALERWHQHTGKQPERVE